MSVWVEEGEDFRRGWLHYRLNGQPLISWMFGPFLSTGPGVRGRHKIWHSHRFRFRPLKTCAGSRCAHDRGPSVQLLFRPWVSSLLNSVGVAKKTSNTYRNTGKPWFEQPLARPLSTLKSLVYLA